jgi:hypothetical protein
MQLEAKQLISSLLDLADEINQGDPASMYRNKIMQQFTLSKTPAEFQASAPEMVVVLEWMIEVAKESDADAVGKLIHRLSNHKRGIREANEQARKNGRTEWNASDLQVAIGYWMNEPAHLKINCVA